MEFSQSVTGGFPGWDSAYMMVCLQPKFGHLMWCQECFMMGKFSQIQSGPVKSERHGIEHQ